MFQSKSKISHIIRGIGLLLLLLWTSFPILFLFSSAFKTPNKIFVYPPSLLFRPALQNFFDLIAKWPQFFDAFRNSMIVAFGSALATIILTTPAGYAFSRYKGKFFERAAFFLLIIRMYPPIVLTVPLFPIFSNLGWVDSVWVLILLYSTFYLSVSSWLMKVFMDEVPIELEEAATLDGANAFQIITKIVMPLSIQGMIATAIFVAVFAWKEYMLAYIFTSTKARTAPVILDQMMSPITGIKWGSLFAAATIQLVPILVFVFLIQGYLVRGLTTGGVKG